MELLFFIKGIIVGFLIAAPVGPIGVLCIRRTLTKGRTAGLLSGLGAATADAFYGFIAGFGLTYISSFILNNQLWLQFIGGLFLAFLGLKIYLAKPTCQTKPVFPPSLSKITLINVYISTFLLTLANPITIISFAAVFTGIGIAGANVTYFSASILVFGIFIGSALWWILLSSGITLLRNKCDLYILHWTNRISGAMLTLFGIIAIITLNY